MTDGATVVDDDLVRHLPGRITLRVLPVAGECGSDEQRGTQDGHEQNLEQLPTLHENLLLGKYYRKA
jgi:hypothetical protein